MVNQIIRTRTLKLVGLILIVVGGIAFLFWRAMQPKIHTASEAEVEAVLPPELLIRTPRNITEEVRFKQLGQLGSRIDPKLVNGALDSRLTLSERSEAAYRFWEKNPKLLDDIDHLLGAGPIQCPPPNQGDVSATTMLSTFKLLSKLQAAGAEAYSKHRDSSASLRMLRLGVRLGDRLMNADGTLITYLVAVAVEAIVNRQIIDTVSKQWFPISACQELLGTATPSPDPDEYLPGAIRRDFQQLYLKILSDPSKPVGPAFRPFLSDDSSKDAKNITGTYDAIATSKMTGMALKLAMENARRPLSQFDRTAMDQLAREGRGLPADVDPEKSDGISKKWDEFKYKFLMNNTRNSLGRKLMSNGLLVDSAEIEVSDKWRANRDLIRILLASRIYQATHSGHLPSTTSGFLSILGAWPTDPFNGKPMIYKPKLAMAYSVGLNLVDDGGAISGGWKSKDIGVLLKE